MGHRVAFLPCILVAWVVRARERVMVACLCSAVLQVQPAGAPCAGLRQRAGGDGRLPALRAGGLPCGLRRRLCQVRPPARYCGGARECIYMRCRKLCSHQRRRKASQWGLSGAYGACHSCAAAAPRLTCNSAASLRCYCLRLLSQMTGQRLAACAWQACFFLCRL